MLWRNFYYIGLEQLRVTGFRVHGNETLSYSWLPEWR